MKIDSLAPVFKSGGNMANVTSAIDKSIDNNDNDNEIPFSRKLTPEMIRLYGD